MLRHVEGLQPLNLTLNSSVNSAKRSFEAGSTGVQGERVVLLEDTWATGATCLSAAGALLRLGAAAVAVLPVCRVVYESFVDEGDPYRNNEADMFDVAHWPR